MFRLTKIFAAAAALCVVSAKEEKADAPVEEASE